MVTRKKKNDSIRQSGEINTPSERRKEQFSEEYLSGVYELYYNGYTNREVAKELGVSHYTVDLWYDKFPEFAHAVKLGRQARREDIYKKLEEVALGQYKYTEEQAVWNSKQGKHEAVKVEKAAPVSTVVKAQIEILYGSSTSRKKSDEEETLSPRQTNVQINVGEWDKKEKDMLEDILNKAQGNE